MHTLAPCPAVPHTRPRVTVIAQCYNHERFLDECLDGIAQQTFRDFELIVIDDCSTDRSRERIEAWITAHRSDAVFLKPPTNLGVSGSLNLAIRHATGEFIIRVATDDAWEPTLLEQLVSRFDESGDEYGAVYADATCVDEDGVRLQEDFVAFHHKGEVPQGDIFPVVCEHNWIPASAILMRASAMRAVGEFDEKLAYEDWDMWIRLSERHRFAFVPTTLARYRIVRQSLLRTLFVPGQVNPNVCATHCAMALKILHSPRATDALRLRWIKKLTENAYSLYESEDARASRYLRAAAQFNRPNRRRLWALSVLAWCRIPPGFVHLLRDAIGLPRSGFSGPQ